MPDNAISIPKNLLVSFRQSKVEEIKESLIFRAFNSFPFLINPLTIVRSLYKMSLRYYGDY